MRKEFKVSGIGNSHSSSHSTNPATLADQIIFKLGCLYPRTKLDLCVENYIMLLLQNC